MRAAWLAVLSMAALPALAADSIAVFAAGSLRAPLTEIAGTYERAHGTQVALTFGASGLLRDRIVKGESADVFASANMEHPESLAARGWSPAPVAFVRNQLCALVRPGLAVDSDRILAVLLDPAVKVGTSTPKADPSGDYAWEVFARAEHVHAGAFAALSAKARQLTGGPGSPPPPGDRNVYGMLVANGDADVFLTYCTNAALAIREHPTQRVVKLPPALAVGATYGAATRHGAPPAAASFVAFLRGPAGQQVFARFGFDPP